MSYRGMERRSTARIGKSGQRLSEVWVNPGQSRGKFRAKPAHSTDQGQVRPIAHSGLCNFAQYVQSSGTRNATRNRTGDPGMHDFPGIFDFIVVGAGSAGSVLAARLSEDPAIRVLLIEAGPSDRSWQLSMPAALVYPLKGTRFNWAYETEPQTELNNRRLYWPRGRVLGGSSSINGMVWIRGHPRDYDDWYRQGLDGWAYCQTLPYFRRIERWSGGADAYRGGDGKVGVHRGAYPNPIFAAYIESARQAGFPVSEDFNGRQFEGFGRFDINIDKGVRQSASATYLRPAAGRKNLTILTETLVTRILFEGRRATGVAYSTGGAVETALAGSEILLCGGAINSPQTLLLSGVGPAADLKALDIASVQDLPGVGRNLHDHLNTSVKYECKLPVTLHGADRFPRNALIGLQYLLTKTGAGATMHTEAGAFVKSGADVDVADIQHHFLPLLVYDNGRKPSDRHGFQCHVCPVRPTSRGWLALKSADPGDHPLLQPNCMTTGHDAKLMIESVKVTREAFGGAAMDPYRGPELFPGPGAKTDAEILDYVRASAVTCYHPVGTCAMGTGERAVVDHDLRVHGIEGLRVVDASVMPQVVSGNTNAPIMMMAEKIADAVLGIAPETPLDVPVAGYDPIRSADLRETAGSETPSHRNSREIHHG